MTFFVGVGGETGGFLQLNKTQAKTSDMTMTMSGEAVTVTQVWSAGSVWRVFCFSSYTCYTVQAYRKYQVFTPTAPAQRRTTQPRNSSQTHGESCETRELPRLPTVWKCLLNDS